MRSRSCVGWALMSWVGSAAGGPARKAGSPPPPPRVLVRDVDPAGVEIGFIAPGDEPVFDRPAISDRAAGDAAARLLQRLEPAMQGRVGVVRRRRITRRDP